MGLILFSACATTRPVDLAQCIDASSHNGQATFYSSKRGGKCTAPMSAKYFVAMPSPLYLAACGSCLEVSGPKGTTQVVVTDECPACTGNDLDLSDLAFAQIAQPSTGRVDITWKIVTCVVEGDIQVDLQGSNPSYLKLRLTNTRNALALVSVQPANASAPIEGKRTSDNFWTIEGTPPYEFPLTVKATDALGNAVTLSVPRLVNDTLMSGGSQFPIGCPR